MVFDSDILIYFLKGNKQVADKMLKLSAKELYTTRINSTELLYGAYNSLKVEENLNKIKAFLGQFYILEFDKEASEVFASLKAKLKKDGNIIADMDLMIASIVIVNNDVLVTNNHKHFNRIENLKIEKWI